MTEPATMPQAWADLIEALTLLARHRNDDISPLHCEHDTLHVCSDPAGYTDTEKARLDELGFHVGDDGFYSFRFGSA